jgi:hypothetical protein
VSLAEARPKGDTWTAMLFGFLVTFVVAVDWIRFIRPDLLLDPDPSWAPARLLLYCSLLLVSTAAGGIAAAAFFGWSGTRLSAEPLRPLPLSGRALSVLALLAIAVGTAFRFVALDRLPGAVYVDEISVVFAAMDLKGTWSDFADSLRFLFFDRWPRGFVGVLYLEGYRLLLRLWGTSVFGVRAHVALAGSASVVTAALLGRALLPRGGGALAALSLAGLRWSLIVSRFAWGSLTMAPIVDLATLALIRARRRASLLAALGGGIVAGITAHIYLAAWIVAAALACFLVWPSREAVPLQRRFKLVAVFVAGFLLAASPILILRKDRVGSYFVRTSDQNIFKEIHRTGSWMPPFAIVADAFQAPWFIPDPMIRHDLRKSRLGWLVGLPVALALLRATRNPREDVSALFFGHAAAACAAAVSWGQPGHPNGVRFAYLTSVAAVAAAAGALWLVQIVTPSLRRAAAFLVIGCLAVSGFLGARDALLRWADSPRIFREFEGEHTLFGRAMLRWERYGRVWIDRDLGHSPMTIQAIHDFRLDPDEPRQRAVFFSSRTRDPRDGERCFQILPPQASGNAAARLVERIRDPGGKEWALVWGEAQCSRAMPAPRPGPNSPGDERPKHRV